ncbi:MAG: phospholipase C [Methylomicrobium sp.]
MIGFFIERITLLMVNPVPKPSIRFSATVKIGLLTSAMCACNPAPALKTNLCPFEAGQRIQETFPNLPHGREIPIDHIIVVMQENRSFDHYFQKLPAFGQPDVDVAPAHIALTSDRGHKVTQRLAATPCLAEEPHSWNKVHEQIDNGRMDGFVAAGGTNAMTYYDASWLPYYYALANTFAIADRYFSSAPDSTWPNRMYMLSGTSFGHIRNEPPPLLDEESSIFHQLENAGADWAIYSAEEPSFEEAIFPKLRAEKGSHFRTIDDFMLAARTGKLPGFSWVTSAGRHNEHPPKNIQAGEKFVAQVIDAVLKSPNWNRMALFFTYDEHGGFYDHVPPPNACPPDAVMPIRNQQDVPGRFDRLGVRVPMIVVSPYAKKHYVSHQVFDHTSVLRFVQARFDLPSLTARDANALPPLDMFDFAHPAFLNPPKLPEAVMDARFLGQCEDTARIHYDDEPAVKK